MVKKIFTCIIVLSVMTMGNAQVFFSKADESRIQLRSGDERTVIPEKYEVYNLDLAGLKDYLTQAPLEFSGEAGLKMQIPLPNGELKWFEVFESPVMQPGISARYPSIKSYKAYGASERSMDMRFALSQQGFYAAVNTLGGEIYIDPYSEDNIQDYIVYNVADQKSDLYKNIPMCGVEHESRPDVNMLPSFNNRTDKVVIREYRLAMACTGEWGHAKRRGTVELCLADINTMVTRLNSIFEREVAIRYLIIDDNDKLIFLDPATDPYENADEGLKIVYKNTEILNNLLPNSSKSYDVGHVLSVCFDIGGVVAGGACNTENKGNGVTCNTDNDLTKVVSRIMAHEIGHQFDASHTWNICKGIEGQRAGNWAYEPGSGSTIMSYAGSCGADNVVGSNNDYYHVGSLIQMFAKTTEGGVAYACANKIVTENHQPVAKVPVTKYTIPIGTPFVLQGEGYDEDGDVLTYCWEQYDLGPQFSLGTSDNPEGPLFRSYKPETNGNIRFFPKPASILTGEIAEKTETLPTVSRTLNFKLTVRDNSPIAEGVVWEDYSVEVTDSAGPFKVTYPEYAEVFKTGQLISVAWDVANTDQSPVNCKQVNIYASYNAAIREDDPNLVPLALGVANNGIHNVIIPNKTTNLFRIIVKAADHIILASSSAPSKVIATTEPAVYAAANVSSLYICQPDVAEITYNTVGLGGFEGDIKFIISEEELPQGVQAILKYDQVKAGENNTLELITDDVVGHVTGQVIIKAITEGFDTITMYTNIAIEGGNINNIQTLFPADGAEGISGLIKFDWNSKPDAVSYEIEIADNPNFAKVHILESKITQDTFYKIGTLTKKSTIYYWRVRAYNNCKTGIWSEVQAFITEALSCKEYKSGVQNIVISTASNVIAELPLTIDDAGTISDLNINLIRATHGRLVDIDAYLVSPSGKEALLWTRACGNQQNINVRLDDQAPDFFQCPINNGRLYRTDIVKGADKLEIFNGEQMQGTWNLRIEDKFAGQGGKIHEFNMEICADINVQSPVLVNNKRLEIHPGDKLFISKDLLEAQDNDNIASELVYTLVNLPVYGEITLNGLALSSGSKFTQEDLNNDRLRYESEADYEGEAYFSFTVYDGNGGWISITNFEIWINEAVPVGTVDSAIAQDVFVYPNPVNDQLNIVVSGKAEIFKNYRLTDISGRTIIIGNLTGHVTGLNIQNLEQGLYILQLTDGGFSVSKKVIKM